MYLITVAAISSNIKKSDISITLNKNLEIILEGHVEITRLIKMYFLCQIVSWVVKVKSKF